MAQPTFPGQPEDPVSGQPIRASQFGDKVRGFIRALLVEGTEDTSGQTSSLLIDGDTGVWRLSELADGDGNTIYDRDTGIGMGLRGPVVVFSSSGTFTKASYPWLRAVRVMVQGAGGGGSGLGDGSGVNNVGGPGGGAGEFRSLLLTVDQLAASETVTVGAAGGGAQGDAGTGGATSFGSHVTADGGDPAQSNGTGGLGGGGGTGGDFAIAGRSGQSTASTAVGASGTPAGAGGDSVLGRGGIGAPARAANTAGGAGSRGGGGGGGYRRTAAVVGGDGGHGLVIVELYG